jgi:hypothetical protein
MCVEKTIEYLEDVEKLRTKRIKALEKRGGPLVAEFLKTSNNMHTRYKYALTGIKYWVRLYSGVN